MNTKAKNAILGMIEAMNDTSIYNYRVEGLTSRRNDENKMCWSFSVYQVSFDEETGEMKYRDLLSDPSEITVFAKALLGGFYISVDVVGTKPENYEDLKKSTWGKPYVRLY
jgi:hypothetical protein